MTNLKNNKRIPYRAWLINRIGGWEHFGNEYYSLLNQLADTRYYNILWNDENRAEDGLLLRGMWNESRQAYKNDDDAILAGECTMLEMMIALADRMDYSANGFVKDSSIEYWFWQMLDNLGLLIFTDEIYEDINGHAKVEDTLQEVLEREYDENGIGGLFPLKHPKKDQRGVEIWYQMNAWLLENVDF